MSPADKFLFWDPNGPCRGPYGQTSSAKRVFRRLAPDIVLRPHENPNHASVGTQVVNGEDELDMLAVTNTRPPAMGVSALLGDTRYLG
jgi:hypothetical protein